MSDHIADADKKVDLDLVELRCKLRGWTVETHDAWVYVYDGDARVATLPQGGARGGCYGIEAHVFTRPRLTLADIVASPPEGWRCVDRIGGSVDWYWGPPDGGAGCIVRVQGARCQGTPAFFADDLAGRAAAHRAVAELLALLGEVE